MGLIINKDALIWYLLFPLIMYVNVRVTAHNICRLNPSGLRGAPGYSLEQAHHLPIEMDPLIGEC